MSELSLAQDRIPLGVRGFAQNRVRGDIAIVVLSHHRTYSSVYGGSDYAIKPVDRIQY
jgi:hypothetical protein